MYNSGLSFVWGSNLALSLERLRISLCSQQLQRWSDEKKSLELWLGLLEHCFPPALFVNKQFDITNRNHAAGAGNKAPQKRPLTEGYAEAIADGVGDSDNQLSVALDALHSPI